MKLLKKIPKKNFFSKIFKKNFFSSKMFKKFFFSQKISKKSFFSKNYFKHFLPKIFDLAMCEKFNAIQKY
jgi:hypothetical protein